MKPRERGDLAEKFAIEFLKKSGYKIIERNFNTKFGEIDIVAVDGKTHAFIEVKYRKCANHGSPYESVNRKKMERLKKAAWCYIQKNGLSDTDLRFDIVSISADKVELFKNAFV